ncbi:MAG: YqgE/AlgH family protein [Chromatiales bacterium]|nr:YqgE/AlgH family protein [Chromatiales bacterium]MDX9767435.1 YqgE/AlgH family protein [Ectothiorhodospiraceae bacterium]
MTKATNFTNQFLIAMPALSDPNFFHSVTLICEHNADGAMGIVVNHPMDITLNAVFEHMQIASHEPVGDAPVYSGGPVQPDRGFILHQPVGDWSSTLRIGDEVAVTTSRDILEALAEGQGPERFLAALGYAGWGPGQLEQEIADNTWLTTPADSDILFALPAAQRWQAAARRLGVDLNLLSGEAGHA